MLLLNLHRLIRFVLLAGRIRVSLLPIDLAERKRSAKGALYLREDFRISIVGPLICCGQACLQGVTPGGYAVEVLFRYLALARCAVIYRESRIAVCVDQP